MTTQSSKRRKTDAVQMARALRAAVLAIAVFSAVSLPAAGGGRAFGSGTPTVEAAESHTRQIAIVIDDFGNSMDGTEQMLNLPVHLTVAVMPFLPTTKQDAEAAHAKGHDVIVHLPMEPVRGDPKWLGPKAILTSLSDEEIRRRVEEAIDDVPYAIGMNNHMGSKATVDERVMRVVLQVCKERGLFFLDSRTAWKSVVPKVAKELQVPLLRNDVFLDDVYTAHHVSHQLTVLKEHLAKQDSCVVIGHVGPPGLITSGALKSAIPQLRKNASFVGLTELLPLPSGVSVR